MSKIITLLPEVAWASCFPTGKCAVIKTSTRQTYFLPVIGLVDPEDMKPGDLVGVNKDSYLILEKLPAEYDSRVKAMEVDSRSENLKTVRPASGEVVNSAVVGLQRRPTKNVCLGEDSFFLSTQLFLNALNFPLKVLARARNLIDR
jgi:hypothetical protein